MGSKEGRKNEKPPAACAVGGLDNAQLLNPVRQAPLPACALEPLIRGPEIDKAMHRICKELGLEVEARMTLIAVEQRSEGRVKTEARLREASNRTQAAGYLRFPGAVGVLFGT